MEATIQRIYFLNFLGEKLFMYTEVNKKKVHRSNYLFLTKYLQNLSHYNLSTKSRLKIHRRKDIQNQ